MPRERRLEFIRRIEQVRNSRVLCYLTGDRRGFETRIHPEVHTMLYDHLQRTGRAQRIDLFVYSTGGVTMAAWSIVNLIREFCDHFSVIIPFKAFSTATLMALGANEIIMGKLGQLGPVDPSVTMPFNPSSPKGRPGEVIPISVEEVASYIKFCQDERFLGLRSEGSLCQVLKELTEKVHPLALGSVYRAIEQIRMLSKKLLQFHMPSEASREIDGIVESLTRSLYSHDYIINRKEAKTEIKLNVVDAESVGEEFENIVYGLFAEYENELKLNRVFNPEILLGQDRNRNEVFHRAFIESGNRTDVFLTENEFVRIQQTPPQVPAPTSVIQSRTIREGWEQVE